jgi:hypothetical protein
MSNLIWRRERDSEHNGRPTYEYLANVGDRRYSIVWAYDHGGTFGYSAYGAEGPLTKRHGIFWGRTLKFCKAACEEIERRYADVVQDDVQSSGDQVPVPLGPISGNPTR